MEFTQRYTTDDKVVGAVMRERIYDEAFPTGDVATWTITKITPKGIRVRRTGYLADKEVLLHLVRRENPFLNGKWETYRNEKHFVSWSFRRLCDGERGEKETGMIDPRRGCAEWGCEECAREVRAFDEAKREHNDPDGTGTA